VLYLLPVASASEIHPQEMPSKKARTLEAAAGILQPPISGY
jgi:hypothetical protein